MFSTHPFKLIKKHSLRKKGITSSLVMSTIESFREVFHYFWILTTLCHHSMCLLNKIIRVCLRRNCRIYLIFTTQNFSAIENANFGSVHCPLKLYFHHKLHLLTNTKCYIYIHQGLLLIKNCKHFLIIWFILWYIWWGKNTF